MQVLGISCFYHDSAATLLNDGKIIAAAQEERFTRRKHDPGFPTNAIKFCLQEGKLSLSELDAIVFYEKPFLKFERLLETYLEHAPRGFESFRKAIPIWISEKIFMKKILKEHLSAIDKKIKTDKIFFSEHHLSHAASAFYPSPFEKSVVLTMDGVGEWATSSIGFGSGSQLRLDKEIHFPHSLGLLYSAFTYFCGFKVNSGEYKLMGLAPYGTPKYARLILDNLIDIKEDGSFKLNLDYFNYPVGLTMTNQKFSDLFKVARRLPAEPITQTHMDIAASIQVVTEKIILAISSEAARSYQCKNLCLAGGVALNCVANGKLLQKKVVDNVWIQPAAGDAGGSLGAALAYYYSGNGTSRDVLPGDSMQGSFLGPSFSMDECQHQLEKLGANFHVLNSEELLQKTTSALTEGNTIGWFQGRMEWGPRSLGARSILADPRSDEMQSKLNLKVKFRESFRPFAPAVLAEEASNWFTIESSSPYMLIVAEVLEKHRSVTTPDQENLFGIEKLNIARSTIPAVTHVDYSSRVQTVDANTNPVFYRLLSAFYKKTNCPVLVNTSFNIRSEPIVCTPEDAYRCFMGTDLDVLVVENCFLIKEEQSARRVNYQNQFELD